MIKPSCGLLAAFIASLASRGALGADPPNFLFVLVDDLGRRDLGVEGSAFYETPNIDALARSGMRFENGYAACQVCSPSRASIFLGQAPARHGITDYIGAASGDAYPRNDPVLPADYVRRLPAADTTLAEAFREAGYRTFYAGKWHLGDEGSWPEDHGFEINRGGWSAGSPGGGYFAPWRNPRLPSGPAGESLAIRLANETADFLDAVRGEPFFAFLSFYHVHSPIQTTEALWAKYRDKAQRMGLTGRRDRFVFDRRLPVRQVQDNPVYAGMIETLDDAVGVVLKKLEETGQAANTVVVFTSDNGGVASGDNSSTSLLPFRGGKGRAWEGGLRVPLYVRAPGVTAPGSVSATPAVGMDFYPTFLELAGLPPRPTQHRDGVSLVPALRGDSVAERDLFWHYPHYGNQGGEPSSVMRSGDWKLIRYHEDGRRELYNLAADPGESTDVAREHPQRLVAMTRKLERWLSAAGALMPRPNPRFDQRAFDERIARARTTDLAELERRHADMLDPNWRPNADWWGSQPRTD